MKITGKTLIDLGFEPNEHFKDMLVHANQMVINGKTMEDIYLQLKAMLPVYITMNDEPIRYSSYLPKP